MPETPNRREVIAGGLLLGGGVIVAPGCDALSTDPGGEGSGEDNGSPDTNEAPQLAERVDAGDLPPLEERLPDQPLVVQPVDRVGSYGGEWRTAVLGPADQAVLYRAIGYDPLMRWNLGFTEPMPNLAEEIDSDPDGSEYRIHLRRGVKWSDGEPFTADDIVFAYNDLWAHDDVTIATPSILDSDEGPPTVEKEDDYTVVFRFPAPNGMFIEALATPEAAPDLRGLTALPRHYLQQFHGDYNDDVGDLVDEGGFSSWSELLENKAERWENPDLPTLCPWQITNALSDARRVVAERNPYYWKVDPDGRQLPYLDSVAFEVVTDPEVLLVQASNGEFTMHARHINTPANKPVLARGRDEGDYEFFDAVNSRMNQMVIDLNQTHPDPNLREIFQNKQFRIGLSHAIDRAELIETVYQGQGEPWQAAPREEFELFDEELAKQYTEFDLDVANQHLDEAGYDETDGDGFRLGPDGARISFNVVVPTDTELPFVEPLELVRDYWHEVGVDMRIQPIDLSLWVDRVAANEHDASVWQGPGGLRDAFFDPRCYFPSGTNSAYGILWANWYLGNEPNEEPPEATRRQMELYDQFLTALDEDERQDLFRQVLAIAREEFYGIGTVLPVGDYGIVKNNFHNVPETMPTSWIYPDPGPSNPEQYFIS